MSGNNIFLTHRRLKQTFLAAIFVAILALSWPYPVLGLFIPVCMLLGIFIGFKNGRKWCDWYCPRGSFWDAFILKISPQKPIPQVFKKIVFRVLVMALLMSALVFNIYRVYPDLTKIARVFVFMLSATTLLGVVLALFIHQRSFCYLCPVGTMIHLTSYARNYLKIDPQLCVECKLCAKACPVGIKPYLFKSAGQIKDRDCLNCLCCKSVCPKKAIDKV
ncbi:MAG: 4Fe-4S binding protein [Candidatus Omnitrophica bacterium]|jgi:polyferredoxin|nr:4Fe-4S binding protein [Candidatus Omnitrophota bacterium]